MRAGLLSAVVLLSVCTSALADPCGMVPPVYLGQPAPLARVGLQKTYVAYHDGMETFVIRPGFTGKVDDFGMLIPFPTPPAIRKVADNLFAHIDKAIDPPEVVIDLNPPPPVPQAAAAPANAGGAPGGGLRYDTVRVLRQEAVGMYEVAVLEAGSAAALKRWMDDHNYKYPEGMDDACNDYVKQGWCFVAVKTKVGQMRGVEPKPGIREVNPDRPPGSTFDGNVQAMGFRFRTDQLVVPMRLSAFNEGELRNVVYLLTDGPKRIRSIPEEYVVRQISGEELYRNVTGPLPLRVIGGQPSDIPPSRYAWLKRRRDPAPHNGLARELFASDLLAFSADRLGHPHEEAEKVLLRIGERLSLRGPQIDELNTAALKADRDKALAGALEGLKRMTLTVIDGDFPREVLASQNLQFAVYQMPARRNSARNYDATRHGPGRKPRGVLHRGELSYSTLQRPRTLPGSVPLWLTAGGLGMALLGAWGWRRRRH